MEKIAAFIVKNKKWICIVFALLVVASIICIPFVGVNYDMTKYLPSDMPTTDALETMNKEFGNNGTCNIMIKDIGSLKALQIKDEIEKVSGVKSVMWLDDMIESMLGKKDNLSMSVIIDVMVGGGEGMSDDIKAMIAENKAQIDKFYNNKNLNFQLIMTGSDYDRSTAKALKSIDKLVANSFNQKVYLSGQAATAYNSVNVTNSETLKVGLIVLPIILLILLLATTSWFEPVLFLLAIGVSVIINMGTNIMLGEISFLTQATAVILQMALSMDYSIFLLHRFRQEKKLGVSNDVAMIRALKHSFSPISASSLTTIAGFVALMFMRYTIGLDMGIVLSKGIVISLLTVFVLMPAMILYCDKIVSKSQHKSLNIPTKAFSTGIKKTRYVLPVLIIALIIPAFIAQGANSFTYGDRATMGGAGSRLDDDRIAMEQAFGISNPLVVLVPKNSLGEQLILYNELDKLEKVENNTIQSYAYFLDMAIKKETARVTTEYKAANPNATESEINAMLIAKKGDIEKTADASVAIVASQLNSENYTRIVVNLLTEEENDESKALVVEIQGLCSEIFQGKEYFVTGPSVACLDIKNVVEKDYTTVTLVSILLVGIILLFTYKSAILPVLLLAVIQGSTWLNMSIPYLSHQPLIFIGYMIVSAIQLGATIDYGILFTSRYVENRKFHDRFASCRLAYAQSTQSILTSGGILCAAGFVLSLASTMSGMSIIGMLIGQGALASVILVLTLLPQLLMIFDKPIRYTMIGGRHLMCDDKFIFAKEPPAYVEQNGANTIAISAENVDSIAAETSEKDRAIVAEVADILDAENAINNAKTVKKSALKKKK